MILQLNDLIPMRTKVGDGYAILVEANAHDIYWTIALSSGALVTLPQDRVLMHNSYTHGRGIDDKRMAEIIKKAAPEGGLCV